MTTGKVIIPYRFAVLGNTAAALAAENGVALDREVVVEIDTGYFKIGDGSTAYNSLDYAGIYPASMIPIADAGGYFTGATVEAALQELGAASSGTGSDPSLGLIDPLYDFLGKPPSSTVAAGGASYPWQSARLDGSITSINGGATAPGVWQLSASSVSNNTSIQLGSTANIVFGGGAWRFPFRFRIPTLSDGTNRFVVNIGPHDAYTGAPTDRIAVRYTDNENSGKLILRATASGANTDANSNYTVAANNWISGYIDINADGTEATLVVGGSTIATVSSGIPTAAMIHGALFSKTVGSTARTLDLDYLAPPQLTFTTPR